MKGRLYGVGVGPGDPELMTLKAVRVIRECPVIAFPGTCGEDSLAFRIARQAVPGLERKELIPLDMPMTKDRKLLMERHEAAAEKLSGALQSGRDIALLTLGDPAVYSTCLYLLRLAGEQGFETELVSGVPSFCAAAAAAGRSLCEWDEPLLIVPSAHRLPEKLDPGCRYVFMKSGKSLKEIRRLIKESGRSAVFTVNCGLPDEQILDDPEKIPDTAGYFTLVLS